MENTEGKRREGVWVYYTNDEGKPRWKCSVCGTVLLPLRERDAQGVLIC